MLWAQLQPAALHSDPVWGFALLGPDREPQPFYQALKDAFQHPVGSVTPSLTAYYGQLLLLAVGTLLAMVGIVVLWPRSAWPRWVKQASDAYRSAPEWQQWLLMGLALFAYRLLPGTWPSLAALAVAAKLIHLRIDIGLAYAVFSIPFFLAPKQILGKSFSLVETLVLLCTVAWLRSWWRDQVWGGSIGASVANLRHRGHEALSALTAMDKWVAVFVALAVLSLSVSANLGVSIRELRVIVIEPVLLYLLLRVVHRDELQLVRLTDALLLAGVAVALLGLYQYFVSGDVIVAEGVRRIRGVYASPNNLSLLLGRLVPLGLAGLLLTTGRRRRAYGLLLVPLLVVLFLTYSRGGWLLSLPAGLLAIGLLRGRRTTLWTVGAVVLCLLLLVPVLGTERFVSLLNAQEGTTFYRLKLWQASIDMIRDHPLTGVGLDNFLYQYPNYMLREAWQEPDLSHPHNIILDFWTRLGLGGVLVLLGLTATFLRTALPLYQRLPDGDRRAIILGWIASMASTWAHGLIDNSFFLVDLAFVFFLGLGTVQAASGRMRDRMPASI
jgi:O-antigen ligase